MKGEYVVTIAGNRFIQEGCSMNEYVYFFVSQAKDLASSMFLVVGLILALGLLTHNLIYRWQNYYIEIEQNARRRR